VTIFSFKLFLN